MRGKKCKEHNEAEFYQVGNPNENLVFNFFCFCHGRLAGCHMNKRRRIQLSAWITEGGSIRSPTIGAVEKPTRMPKCLV